MKLIIKILKYCVARFLPRKDFKSSGGFKGVYFCWEDASRQCGGYNEKVFFERLIESTRSVVNGESIYERDTVLFDRINYDWPLLACLMKVAIDNQSLNVIDFGGALGSTYRQNFRFLNNLPNGIKWNVVEQEELVCTGEKEFKTKKLRFFNTITKASCRQVDVIIFACSLSYLPDPYRYLEEAEQANSRYLIYDRLPITENDEDYITIQSVSPSIYKASYPMWIFSRSKLNAALEKKWCKIESWDAKFQPRLNDVVWEGAFYQRANDINIQS
ncbi:MAG: methyltransferase, TIGR04325 family [Candidatus Hinthialibacter antarcticus]|nr:methyltransferase, TIGR04325 family [Candidatus Hinthialibacter antarcticus]